MNAVSQTQDSSLYLDTTGYAPEPLSIPSRPHSQFSDISVASSRAHSVEEPRDRRALKLSPRSSKAKEQEIQQDWGLTDPAVVEALLRRNKRLK